MQKVEPVLDVIQKERQMERHTGEPCAVKAASTVRRGAVGKVPKGNSLAAYPTIGAIHQACGGAIRWSRKGGGTRRPSSPDDRTHAEEYLVL